MGRQALRLGQIQRKQLAGKRCEGQLCIADEAQCLVVAADFGAVDVQMDEARATWQQIPGIRAVLVGSIPDQQDHVGLVDERSMVTRHPARAHEISDDAKRERMALVDRTFAHRRGCDRQASALLQLRQLCRRVRQMHAAASHDKRTRCVCEQIPRPRRFGRDRRGCDRAGSARGWRCGRRQSPSGAPTMS